MQVFIIIGDNSNDDYRDCGCHYVQPLHEKAQFRVGGANEARLDAKATV